MDKNFEKELVSIVIPVKFRADLLQVCIDSIVAYTPEKYELILVCDDVDKKEFEFLNNYKAKIMYNDIRLGFPKTVNRGILESHGEYVMILNLDTVVTPGWLTEMLKAFKLDEKIGMVAPTFCETGGIQHVDHNKDGTDYTYCDQIMGICMFLKRKVLCEIGLLDEQFGLGGGEDLDLCMKVKVAGYKTVVARKSFIYHYGSASFREEFKNDIPYSKKYSSNRFFVFKRKWEKELGQKPRIYIAVPNMDGIHPELVIRLIEWTHDPEIVIHLNMPMRLSPLDNARNICVKDMLEDYYDYLLFVDSNIIPPPNALRELLAADKEIIAPLCFTWKPGDDGIPFPCPVAHRYDKNGEYRPYYGKGIEETDVITGGMHLVKREVYEKIDRPYYFTYHANGTVIYSEDFVFSQQCQALGYKLYTHYGLICGHYKDINIKDINDLMVKYGKCNK